MHLYTNDTLTGYGVYRLWKSKLKVALVIVLRFKGLFEIVAAWSISHCFRAGWLGYPLLIVLIGVYRVGSVCLDSGEIIEKCSMWRFS